LSYFGNQAAEIMSLMGLYVRTQAEPATAA